MLDTSCGRWGLWLEWALNQYDKNGKRKRKLADLLDEEKWPKPTGPVVQLDLSKGMNVEF